MAARDESRGVVAECQQVHDKQPADPSHRAHSARRQVQRRRDQQVARLVVSLPIAEFEVERLVPHGDAG